MTQIQPHQQRVLEEREQLATRLKALNAFLDRSDPSVSNEEFDLLIRQANVMEEYLAVLDERIACFLKD